MKILVFVPQSRILAPSIASIQRVDPGPHQVVTYWAKNGGQPLASRWENVTRKYQAGRRMFLDGDFDALLCVEDDILIPPDALLRLDALEADIAYGLVTSRREPYLWSADIQTGPGDGDYLTYDMQPDKMRAAWGRVIDVVGCGLYCTLIRRPVLEQLEFTIRGSRCCDFYFAYDAYQAGFSQQCDTRVLCGHLINSEGPGVGPPWQVVYPDGARRYRIEEVAG